MEYRDLAGLVDYHLSSPLMTEEQVHEGCMRAQSYEVRSVVVRPCDLDLAKEWVVAPVRLASRTSAAPGDATTAVKQFETRDLLRRGAVDVEAKVNLPKMMSRQFQYVEIELMQLLKTCEEGGAKLTASCDVSVLDEERQRVSDGAGRGDAEKVCAVCGSETDGGRQDAGRSAGTERNGRGSIWSSASRPVAGCMEVASGGDASSGGSKPGGDKLRDVP
jgi:deoxyribose-phosphate aldolase